jgi:hypothetical protein
MRTYFAIFAGYFALSACSTSLDSGADATTQRVTDSRTTADDSVATSDVPFDIAATDSSIDAVLETEVSAETSTFDGETSDAEDAMTFSVDAPSPHCDNTGVWATNDPRSVCAVRCVSGDATFSDASVSIDQVSLPTDTSIPQFVVQVNQSYPATCDETFTGVTSSWSGHFFNFFGNDSVHGFHLLTNGVYAATASNNVEVYPVEETNSYSGGPVEIPNSTGGSLLCMIYRN